MMKAAKRCTRCILPSSFRNISFDVHGVCNYCNAFEVHRQKLSDYDSLALLFEQRVERVKQRKAADHDSEYDCLVGISGGKDSSWLAWKMADKHKCRVLTFTFNNGFLTPWAKENITNLSKKLNLPHFFYDIDWRIHGQVYKNALTRLGYPCLGCSYCAAMVSQKIAFERNIPLFVHGRSRYQMFKEFLPGSPDPTLALIPTSLTPYNKEEVNKSQKRVVARARKVLEKTVDGTKERQEAFSLLFPNFDAYQRADVLPEALGYFLYYPYDEKAMMDELEKELDWKRPNSDEILGHSDCEIHEAAVYISNAVLGYPLLAQELSVMIREGEITREDALIRLSEEKALTEYPHESINYLCDRFGVNESDLPRTIRYTRRVQKALALSSNIKRRLLRPKIRL